MSAPKRPTRDQVDAAIAMCGTPESGDHPAVYYAHTLATEVRALRAEREAALALAVEWEQEANARQPHNLMGYEIHEMNGEQSTCRAHVTELREALGRIGPLVAPLPAVPDGNES